ncbi:MAG: cupin [Acidovorax sp.]
MPMIEINEFTPKRAWDFLPIMSMNGVSARVHWTDRPFKWHINVGDEVFVVLSGSVEMHYREDVTEQKCRLGVGDVFYAHQGMVHVACPLEPSYVLVVEKEEGSSKFL